MFLGDAMTAGRIVVNISASGIMEAIPQILQRIDAAELPLPREKITRAVLEHEAAFSTYIGHGLAVPHARFEGIENPVVLLAQSKTGIPVPNSSERIHLIFLLLTPQSAPQFQVRLLARISGLMQSEYFVECLRDYDNPQAIMEVIRAADPALLS